MWFNSDEQFVWQLAFGIRSLTVSHHGVWRKSNPLSDWAILIEGGKPVKCVPV